MSSILDALKKLETEKLEASRRVEEFRDAPLAVHELVGPSLLRDRVTLRLNPLFIVTACIVIVLIIISASVAVSVYVARPVITEARNTTPEDVVIQPIVQEPPKPAEPTPAPVSTPIANASVPVAPTPEITSQPAVNQAKSIPEPVVNQTSSTKINAKSASGSEPQPSKPIPLVVPPPSEPAPVKEPVAMAKRSTSVQEEIKPPAVVKKEIEFESNPLPESFSPTPVPEKPARTEPQQKNSTPASIEINKLPILTESDKERFGIGDLRVNMTRPANPKTRPYASAIINLKPVYVGERIPGGGARLIAVDDRGIAIEIEGSGEQFYLR